MVVPTDLTQILWSRRLWRSNQARPKGVAIACPPEGERVTYGKTPLGLSKKSGESGTTFWSTGIDGYGPLIRVKPVLMERLGEIRSLTWSARYDYRAHGEPIEQADCRQR